MRILLDTQALILAGQGKLPRKAALAFTDNVNEIFFSHVSLWEMGLKASLGKLKFDHDLLEYHDLLVKDLGLTSLAISVAHLHKCVALPWCHKDPFDRLLIGQALLEDLFIMTGDRVFSDYGCRRIWDS